MFLKLLTGRIRGKSIIFAHLFFQNTDSETHNLATNKLHHTWSFHTHKTNLTNKLSRRTPFNIYLAQLGFFHIHLLIALLTSFSAEALSRQIWIPKCNLHAESVGNRACGIPIIGKVKSGGLRTEMEKNTSNLFRDVS